MNQGDDYVVVYNGVEGEAKNVKEDLVQKLAETLLESPESASE